MTTEQKPDNDLDFVRQLFRKSDRYELMALIGQGGMGQVFKAIDRELDEVVALKLLKPKLSSDAAVIARFKQEIKLTRRIKHKNVARIFDLGEVGGFKFISMEYIDGKSLKDTLLSRGQFPLALALHVHRQVLDGMDAAHEEGIVHRDIKPQNIMVTRDFTAYVLDFGIARSLESEDLFQIGVLVGSPAYMSTEQALRKEVDHRSDIYSLGVLLFEMLTGGPPFRARTVVAVANKHVTEAPPDPRTIRPDIPAWLAELVLRCLEKDPNARFQSVREMIALLDGHATSPGDTLASVGPAGAASHGAPRRTEISQPEAPTITTGATSTLPPASARGAAAAAAPFGGPAELLPPPKTRPSALLGDADPETVMVVKAKLEALGLDVEVVADGVSAVDRAVAGSYDLLVLAGDLPRLDGLEGTRILKNYVRTRETPVMVLLAAGRDDQAGFAYDSGAADVLTKPVNASTLAKKTRTLLGL